MQATKLAYRLFAVLALVLASFAMFSFSKGMGLDSYEIYLNKTLILKQYVNQPLSLRKLPLNKAKPGDELRIKYRHCNEPVTGSNRSITIKDAGNKVLKSWNFANGSGKEQEMVIPVKELLDLYAKSGQQSLTMHYGAKELHQAEMLAKLSFN